MKASFFCICPQQENCKAQKQSVCDKFDRMISILGERHKVRFGSSPGLHLFVSFFLELRQVQGPVDPTYIAGAVVRAATLETA